MIRLTNLVDCVSPVLSWKIPAQPEAEAKVAPATVTTDPTSEDDSQFQLYEAIKRQIEYYFSKENLQSDAYLQSQMDASMCVPISVIMKVLLYCSSICCYPNGQ